MLEASRPVNYLQGRYPRRDAAACGDVAPVGRYRLQNIYVNPPGSGHTHHFVRSPPAHPQPATYISPPQTPPSGRQWEVSWSPSWASSSVFASTPTTSVSSYGTESNSDAGGKKSAVEEEEFPLCSASRYGNATKVRLMLGVPGVDVNCGNRKGERPLELAVHGGHAEVVKMLLKRKDVDVRFMDKRQRTLLMHATNRKRAVIVKYLLARKDLDVNAADERHDTALHVALKNGYDRIVLILLRRGDLNVHQKIHSSAPSALEFALFDWAGNSVRGSRTRTEHAHHRSGLLRLFLRHGSVDVNDVLNGLVGERERRYLDFSVMLRYLGYIPPQSLPRRSPTPVGRKNLVRCERGGQRGRFGVWVRGWQKVWHSKE